MKQKDTDELESMLGASLSNLIDLMDTRIALDYLDKQGADALFFKGDLYEILF